jgi:hypothetical protein
MLSKSSRSSNKRHDNLGLGNPHTKRQERAAPNHRTNDREKMERLRKTSPGCKKIRTPERKIKISGSGVNYIRALGITLLIVAKSSHWCLR